jgi:erythronate-4-phosphate dehydrogenase
MGQKINIVVNKHTPFVTDVFRNLGNVIPLDTREITKDAVKDADILIVRSETCVDKSLIEGSRIKFIGSVTIGTDHVDRDFLSSKGITFTSAPGSNANSVGEYVVAVLLACKKGFTLKGKTLGIVGVGNVGSNVWRKAEALGMKVMLNDPPLERSGSAYPLRSLDDLMETDIISIHVPLTRTGPDATFHFFDEKRIRKMKKGSILINTSRGAVVETEALKHALHDGHLQAAALDVWEKEPNISTSLLELVTLATPHIAGYSLDGKLNALRMTYKAVCSFLSVADDGRVDSVTPAPPLSEIRINAEGGQMEKILQNTVKQCYDIETDDRGLRNIISVPEQERGRFFSSLRANYRIRREFMNVSAVINIDEDCGSVPARDIAKVLREIGFKIKN